MTPDALAALHAQCFTMPRPWSAQEFADLLDRADIVLETATAGFALVHDLGVEAELLTIAVAPTHRRQGVGRHLLNRVVNTLVQRHCSRLVLEVAADNAAGIALYHDAGFRRLGRRPGYYRVPGADPMDALILGKTLIPDQTPAGSPKIG